MMTSLLVMAAPASALFTIAAYGCFAIAVAGIALSMGSVAGSSVVSWNAAGSAVYARTVAPIDAFTAAYRAEPAAVLLAEIDDLIVVPLASLFGTEYAPSTVMLPSMVVCSNKTCSGKLYAEIAPDQKKNLTKGQLLRCNDVRRSVPITATPWCDTSTTSYDQYVESKDTWAWRAVRVVVVSVVVLLLLWRRDDIAGLLHWVLVKQMWGSALFVFHDFGTRMAGDWWRTRAGAFPYSAEMPGSLTVVYFFIAAIAAVLSATWRLTLVGGSGLAAQWTYITQSDALPTLEQARRDPAPPAARGRAGGAQLLGAARERLLDIAHWARRQVFTMKAEHDQGNAAGGFDTFAEATEAALQRYEALMLCGVAMPGRAVKVRASGAPAAHGDAVVTFVPVVRLLRVHTIKLVGYRGVAVALHPLDLLALDFDVSMNDAPGATGFVPYDAVQLIPSPEVSVAVVPGGAGDAGTATAIDALEKKLAEFVANSTAAQAATSAQIDRLVNALAHPRAAIVATAVTQNGDALRTSASSSRDSSRHGSPGAAAATAPAANGSTTVSSAAPHVSPSRVPPRGQSPAPAPGKTIAQTAQATPPSSPSKGRVQPGKSPARA
jgi:hypothetical protein